MPELYSIENALQITGFNLARVKLLARFLIALIACRTVCLTEIASAMPGNAQTASHYKRLQRFLSKFDFDPLVIARLTLCWMQSAFGLVAPYVLALDRTNWKFAKTEINILTLAVVYKGVGFPLLWLVLGKAGNSSTEERKVLLSRYLKAFAPQSIAYLTADREFGGTAFLRWLRQEKIAFVIRVRGNVGVTNAQGQTKTARGLFWHCKAKDSLSLGERTVFRGKHCMRLYVSGMRLTDGDFLIVVSDRASPGGDLLAQYKVRWGIETLFGNLKRRGRETLFAIRSGGDAFARFGTIVTPDECAVARFLLVVYVWNVIVRAEAVEGEEARTTACKYFQAGVGLSATATDADLWKKV